MPLSWPPTLSHLAVPRSEWLSSRTVPPSQLSQLSHLPGLSATASAAAAALASGAAAPSRPFDGVMTSALVPSPAGGRVLLVRRAAHDSLPNRWEMPGGSVDEGDQTLLHACARELFEEAGLTATRVVRHAGAATAARGDDDDPRDPSGRVFTNSTGSKVIYGYTLVVEVNTARTDENGEPVVTLDPNEHSAYRWVTEDEVVQERAADGTEMPITVPAVRELLLQEFARRRAESTCT